MLCFKFRYEKILTEISRAPFAKKHLPFVPHPILQAEPDTEITIIRQAPVLKVQQSGKPWDDARSGTPQPVQAGI